MTSFRPRTLRLGAMRERITIQAPTETLDDYGEPIVEWTDIFTSEPASMRHTGGTEVSRGEQVEANVKAVFTVRYRDGIDSTMRIVHEGRAYGILHVNPVQGGRRYIELLTAASGAL